MSCSCVPKHYNIYAAATVMRILDVLMIIMLFGRWLVMQENPSYSERIL